MAHAYRQVVRRCNVYTRDQLLFPTSEAKSCSTIVMETTSPAARWRKKCEVAQLAKSGACDVRRADPDQAARWGRALVL